MRKIIITILISFLALVSSAQQVKIDTIIKVDNFEITFKKVDTLVELVKSNFQKTIDYTVSKSDNSHIKSRLREKLFIERYDSLIKKDSTKLFLKIDKGEKWKLIELSTIKDEYENTLFDFYENENLYLVRTQWGEGNNYKIVNKTNGIIIETFGEPVFAKSENFIMSLNVDLVAEYTENGFEFFKKIDEEIVKIGEFKPNNWGPEWALEIAKNKFIIKCYSVDDYLNKNDFFMEINLKNNDR